MMDSLWIIIQQNWVGTLLGLIALVIAIYEMLKRRGPGLSYQFSGQRIVGRHLEPLPSQVTIEFEGQAVDHLSRTEIILWNAGPAALRRGDIPPTDPLSVQFSNGRVLLSEVTKVVRESSNFTISNIQNQAGAEISFEYLDKGDGALLTIWHDAFDTTPIIHGVIIGQRAGIISFGRFIPPTNTNIPVSTPVGMIEKTIHRYRKLMKYGRVISWLPIPVGLFFIIGSVFQYQLKPIIPFLYVDQPDAKTMWAGIMLGILYTIPGFILIRAYSRRFPKELIPDQFSPELTSRNAAEGNYP